MKLQIEGYEIEIKARYNAQERNSKKAALSFINTLSLLYSDSAKYYEIKNESVYQKYAEIQFERSRELYKICEQNGLYKDL